MKWKTVSMERRHEKTGKPEIVGIALRTSFKISMKEHVCMFCFFISYVFLPYLQFVFCGHVAI